MYGIDRLGGFPLASTDAANLAVRPVGLPRSAFPEPCYR